MAAALRALPRGAWPARARPAAAWTLARAASRLAAPPAAPVPVAVPVSLPDERGQVTLTVPLGGDAPTRFRLPLTMSIYDMINELKHERHWTETAAAPAARKGSGGGGGGGAARVRVVDGGGHELDQSLPLCEVLRAPFVVDLGDGTAFQPDGRAFTEYMKALAVELEELRTERQYLETLLGVAARQAQWRDTATRLGVGGALLAELGVIVYLTYEIGWDIMEPTTYLIGLANATAGLLIYNMTRQEFAYSVHLEGVLERWRRRHLRRLGYDAERHAYVTQRLERLERLLKLYEKRGSEAARRARLLAAATPALDAAAVAGGASAAGGA